jgi:CRISPR-associated exonuclease Cas4
MSLEPISVSALEHYAYCPRQCALIHLEAAWDDNIFTMRGRRLHETVDVPKGVIREDLRIERSLPVWSERYRLIGIADIVEFLPDGTPYPVEYKPGKKKRRIAVAVQLCGYALCLEEMFARSVPEGAIFYHGSRRRLPIPFTETLRRMTLQTIDDVRVLLQQNALPPPVNDARCPDCSLMDICVPAAPLWLAQEVSADAPL